MSHIHHIIPKHASGSDDPSNLVELTVEDHAIAHKVLFWFWKREEDKIAWLALSGQIDKEEATRMAASAWCKKNNLGKKHSDQTKQRMSDSHLNRIEVDPQFLIRRGSAIKTSMSTETYKSKKKLIAAEVNSRPEVRASISASLRGRTKETVKCHCGAIGGKPTMTRWHLNNCKVIK